MSGNAFVARTVVEDPTTPGQRLAIDSSGRITVILGGGAAGEYLKAEDAAHVSGDLGVQLLAVYRATPTLDVNTAGDYSHLIVGPNGELFVGQATLFAGESQTDNRMMTENAWTSLSIPTQTTTTVKSGAGKLGYILIPTQVASATVKVYDNTAGSGTVLMDTLTMPATLLNEGPFMLNFGGTIFSTGLTIVTAGATMPIDVGYL